MTTTLSNPQYGSSRKVEKLAAEQFLTLLAEGVEAFTFQTFDDNKHRKDSALTRLLHGTLGQHFDELCRLNGLGAGIFVTVNETDLKGRTKANIVNVRAVFQEADRHGVPTPPLTPHIVVETSAGKFHRYWLTRESKAALDDYEGVMRTMVEQFGSDPNARDLARVLRLPGFFHLKDVGNTFLVSIVEASHAQPYTWEQITAVIPPSPAPAPESTKPQGAQGSFGKEHWRVLSAVKVLNSDCEYGVWLAAGMALHHGASGGLTGFIFWDDWSAQGNSYRDGETKYKWSTFGKGNGAQITIATLFHHAGQNGWEWDQQHQLSVLPEAGCFVVKAIEEAGADKSTILSEEVIAALSLIKSCDPRAYESLRMRCSRRLNIDPPCRFNIDPGRVVAV
jgi:hypothetical protein